MAISSVYDGRGGNLENARGRSARRQRVPPYTLRGMARYSCPQCGRGFGSVGEMLTHTQNVHASEEPYAESRAANPVIPTRGMPSSQPGPVASGRASQTGFEVEGAGAGRTASPRQAPPRTGFPRPGTQQPGGEDEEAEPAGNPRAGTLIAVLIIVAIVILNILGGGE